jgi:hypothetical protein
MGLRGGFFKTQLGHQGRAHMNGMSALIKRKGPQSSLSPFHTVRRQKRKPCIHEEGPYQRGIHDLLNFNFPSKNCEK